MLFRLMMFMTAFLVLSCIVFAVSAAVYEEPAELSDGINELTLPSGIDTVSDSSEPETACDYDSGDISETQTEAATESAVTDQQSGSYTARTSAPSYDNKYYYSDENAFYAADFGMPNCTCYAWGRAYEILKEKPELCLWDAGYWYDYNLEHGIYDYGDTPKEGAIACWQYSDGGPGHVAVVESVDGDTVTLSNSAYSGTEFYMSTAPVSDPSGGMENWIFRGYIYIV